MYTNDNLILFGIKNIVKKYSDLLQLKQIPEIEYVAPNEICGFIGSARFIVVNGELKFYIQIDKTQLNQDEINKPNSQTHGIVYHELSHLQNIQQLCNNIPLDLLVQDFSEWRDFSNASYQMAFMLWGEYYAYKKQFEKFKYHSPVETQLLQHIKTFCDDVINGNYLLNKKQPLHRKYMNILRQDVYNILYDIIEHIAYKSIHPSDTQLSRAAKSINDFLHINITSLIQHIINDVNQMWNIGSDNITLSNLQTFGDTLWQFFDILEFDVDFIPELEILFDKSQPLMRFAYGE